MDFKNPARAQAAPQPQVARFDKATAEITQALKGLTELNMLDQLGDPPTDAVGRSRLKAKLALLDIIVNAAAVASLDANNALDLLSGDEPSPVRRLPVSMRSNIGAVPEDAPAQS
jgi:hypothetical protein